MRTDPPQADGAAGTEGGPGGVDPAAAPAEGRGPVEAAEAAVASPAAASPPDGPAGAASPEPQAVQGPGAGAPPPQEAPVAGGDEGREAGGGVADSAPRHREYRIDLDVYSGPLDLLLYLIKRDEIDIQDIPIARVTAEYAHFLELFAGWNINMAGEFLVMAATLMEIKSRMLLPEPPPLEEDEEEELEDPRSELVRQLMEYKRFKEAAVDLGDRAEQRAMRYSRPGERPQRAEEAPPPAPGVDLWVLVEVFEKILKATGVEPAHLVEVSEVPQEVVMGRLEDRMRRAKRLRFVELFEGERSRPILVAVFLALLELCKLFILRAEQPEPFGDIWMVYVPEEQRPIRMEPVRPEEGTFKRGQTAGMAELDRSFSGAVEDEIPAPADEELDAEIQAVAVRDVTQGPPELGAPAPAAATAEGPSAPPPAAVAPPDAAAREAAGLPESIARQAPPAAVVRYRPAGLLGLCRCCYGPWRRAQNLSEWGVRFVGRRRLRIGRRLKLQVRFGRGEERIDLRGRVCWCRPVAQGGRFDVGVEFDRVSGADRSNADAALARLRERPFGRTSCGDASTPGFPPPASGMRGQVSRE